MHAEIFDHGDVREIEIYPYESDAEDGARPVQTSMVYTMSRDELAKEFREIGYTVNVYKDRVIDANGHVVSLPVS